MTARRARQQGATLLIVLIMLIMLTLFAVSAMNTGTMNLKVIGNMQARGEALDASQWMIDRVISTTQFTSTPNNAITNPCDGIPNTLCWDMNGDGNYEYTTKLSPAPACVQARAKKVGELRLKDGTGKFDPAAEDVACLQAQQQGGFGIAGAASSGDSLCADTLWEITAQTLNSGTTATTSSVNMTTTQGVSVRVKALDMAANCP
jgi:Tfp pilus assembly protein PilX